MPEGDTIYRVARRVHEHAVGRRVERFEDRFDQYPREHLEGATLAGAEARGKHLVMPFSNGRVVHSHMGMTGAWHVYRSGSPWQKPVARCRFVLDLGSVELVLFSPKLVELVDASTLSRHPLLSRLGPDLLAPAPDLSLARERLKTHGRTPIGVALMNQQLVAGIGNVYKSELLFIERLDPFLLVAHLDDTALDRLLARARALMRRNLDGSPRRTRYTTRGPRLWVYNRHRQPCFVCGEPIAMTRQGEAGRSTYWCRACQRTDLAKASAADGPQR